MKEVIETTITDLETGHQTLRRTVREVTDWDRWFQTALFLAGFVVAVFGLFRLE